MALAAAVAVLAAPVAARAATWTSGAPHGVFDGFVVGHPTDPDTAYLLADSTVFATHDRGLHWLERGQVRASTIAAYAGPPTLLVALAEDGTVARSVDDGATWQTTGCCADAVDPLDPARLLGHVPEANDLERSTDGGTTWEPVAPPPLPVSGIFFPQFAGGGVAYEETFSGATYRSADLGSTWQLVTGVPLGRISGVSSDPLRFWVGPYRTLDGGATWTDAGTADGCAQPIVPVLKPLRPWTIACDGVFRSTDGGTTWAMLPGTPAHQFEVEPRHLGVLADGQAALVLGREGPWLVEPGGVPIYRADGLPPFTFGALVADPRDPASAFSGAFTTRDGGSTWVPDGGPARTFMVRVRDQLLVLDAGLTTERASGGPAAPVPAAIAPQILVADPAGRRAWILLERGVLTTSDGVHFHRLHNSLPASGFAIFPTLAVAAGGRGRTLAVLGAHRGAPAIAVSRDAGRTYHLRRAPTLVQRLEVDAVDGRLLAAIDTHGRLYRSRNGGGFRTTLHGVSAIAVDPGRRGHWYASRGTRLYVTSNGGATWRLVQRPPSASSITALSAGAGRLWVATGEGIFSRSLAEDGA